LGYVNENRKKMILAVWNMETIKVDIDLKKYNFSKIEPIYPSDFSSYKYKFNNGILSVDSGEKNRARLFVLTV